MLDPPLVGDGVEALADGVDAADRHDAILPADLGGNRRRADEDAGALLAERLHQRAVVELADDGRPDAGRLEPVVELPADDGALARQQHRRAGQRLREAAAQPRRQRRRGEAGDVALAEQVAVGLHVDRGRHRRVGEHQVDLVQGEGGEQRLGPRLAADHPDRRRQLQRRRQQAIGDLLAEHVGDADDEAHRPPGGAALHGVEELTAEREDLVGVAVDHLADVGRHQPAADAGEQLLAEPRLERLDLRAHRRLRQPQLLRGPHHAAFAHDRPEVEQVMVVEPFHGVACPLAR